jgi:hypothetical protein
MLGMYHVTQAATEATKSTVRTEPAMLKPVRKEGRIRPGGGRCSALRPLLANAKSRFKSQNSCGCCVGNRTTPCSLGPRRPRDQSPANLVSRRPTQIFNSLISLAAIESYFRSQGSGVMVPPSVRLYPFSQPFLPGLRSDSLNAIAACCLTLEICSYFPWRPLYLERE